MNEEKYQDAQFYFEHHTKLLAIWLKCADHKDDYVEK